MNQLALRIGVFSCLATLALGSPAVAADPPAPRPAPAAAATAGADIVLMKDGIMVRGTIVEVAAGKEVVIQTVTGTTRAIPVDQIKYWGPAAGMPAQGGGAPTQPVVSSSAGGVQVHLGAEQAGLTYYVRGSIPGLPESAGFTRLCTAPCDISIPVGTYHFAATSGDAMKPATYRTPIDVRANLSLTAKHESKSGARTAGWVTMGVGLGLGAILAIYAANMDAEECSYSPGVYPNVPSKISCEDTSRNTVYYLALASGIVGLIGIPIGLTSDRVEIKPANKTAAFAPKVQWPALAAGQFRVLF